MVKIRTIQIKLRPKEKLIKSLIENKEPQSIMSLSGSAVMDYKNAYNLVSQLQASGAIIKEAIGNINTIKLNPTPSQEVYSVEEKRTKEFLEKHPNLYVLKKFIDELNYPFLIVLIFGSYAKNQETKNSDVDLCIISDNEEKTKALWNNLNLLSLKLEIQEFTTEQFISMIEKRQRNLGHEIIKSNIILYGIENYYNLISKWMKKE